MGELDKHNSHVQHVPITETRWADDAIPCHDWHLDLANGREIPVSYQSNLETSPSWELCCNLRAASSGIDYGEAKEVARSVGRGERYCVLWGVCVDVFMDVKAVVDGKGCGGREEEEGIVYCGYRNFASYHYVF